MARSHGIAVVLTIFGGAAFWLWSALRTEPDAPPLPPMPATSDRTAQDAPVERESSRAIERKADTKPPPPIESPKTNEPAPAPEPAATAQIVTAVAQVSDLTDRTLIPAFRWTFRSNGKDDLRGSGKDGHADLTLPHGAQGALFVEAEGYAPERVTLTLPALASAPIPVDVFLTRNQALVGVTISARDDQAAPVARLRLDLWQIPGGTADPAVGTDPTTKPVWTRMGNGTEGSFRLPDLPAGRLALRAQPVDDRGDALPLLPWRQVFAFSGNESVPFVIDFEPGLVLSLSAAADGKPEAECAITLRRGGEVMPAIWRSRTDDQGPGTLGQDLVTLPGTALTALAVPPGDYAIEVGLGAQSTPAAFAGNDGRKRLFTFRLPR
jgi:hypothetical protein